MLLDIVYQDQWFVAINKPAGLLVHRSPIDRHETRFALQILRDQIGQHVFPIHRLDKPTSGILLFALDPDDARAVHRQFTEQTVDKRYLAVCRGYTPDEISIDHAIRDRDDRSSKRKTAITRLTTLARTDIPVAVDKYPTSRYSLVQLKPVTGRRHQLRAHMKHIAHPIIGDAKYGRGEHNRFFNQHFDSHRLLLASCFLRFYHPHLQQDVSLCARPTDDFCQTLEQLGIKHAMPEKVHHAA